MQDDRYPFAPPPLPGDTARPRRRHRSHNRGGARLGQNHDPQNQDRNQSQPQVRPAAVTGGQAQTTVPQREGGARRHRRRGGGQNQTPAQNAPRAQQAPAAVQNSAQPQHPANAANTPRPQQQPRRAPAAPPRAEDPGLPLISRRPPKQKFANFEEYIAAHGGVTAPLPGDGAAPQQSPDPE